MSFVYAIGARDDKEKVLPIKIGQSADPISRCRNLQAGSPVVLSILAMWEITSGAVGATIEQHLHRRFSDRNAYGEWFFVSVEEVEDYIARRIVGVRGSFGAPIRIIRHNGTEVEPIRLPFNKSTSTPVVIPAVIETFVPPKSDWKQKRKAALRNERDALAARIISNKDSPAMREMASRRKTLAES